jgi:5,10-methylenetetrahydromethanopterin reductase
VSTTTFGIGPLPQYPTREWLELAPAIEALGFDKIWIPDERFYRDIAVTLSTIGTVTSSVGIGTAVTDPYIRHPALTAQWTATIDELSGGRMHVGIGAGIAGFSALGIRRARPVRAIREAVELIDSLWHGDVTNYEGELIQFHDASLDFKPPRSRIPIYVAGRGPLILQLAGEVGDGVMIGSLASAAAMSYALTNVEKGLSRAKRTQDALDVAIWLHTAIADDRQAARDAVKMIIVGVLLSSRPILDQLGLTLDDELSSVLAQTRYIHGSEDVLRAAAMLSDDLVDTFAVAGPPDEVASRLIELRDAGVNHFALKPWLVPGQSLLHYCERIAKEVMPRVR